MHKEVLKNTLINDNMAVHKGNIYIRGKERAEREFTTNYW